MSIIQSKKMYKGKMIEWKNVTGYFTEEKRHYKNTYFEIDYFMTTKLK